ncbi:hypothetical protein ACP275_14G179000 [Erythranthe tilingii]
MADSEFRERNGRKTIANILKLLDFEDTPQSRKLDPWMIDGLAAAQQKEIEQKKNKGKEIARPSEKDNIRRDFLHDSPKDPTAQNIRAGRVSNAKLMSKILEKMNGNNLKFVFEKKLKATDIDKNQNRLLIAKGVENEFLNKEEKMKLRDQPNEGTSKHKESIMVKIMVFNQDYYYEGEIRVHEIKLSKWNGEKYVMNGKWGRLVEEYELKEDMIVELWVFRVNSELYFALIKLKNKRKLESDE